LAVLVLVKGMKWLTEVLKLVAGWPILFSEGRSN
jgi:hypothetical protein